MNRKQINAVLILCLFAVSCFLFSCSTEEKVIEREYTVRLSNWVGSDYYKCDSLIWVNKTHFKLKNKEDEEPFMEIIIPEGVTVRVSKNN